jgi:hypothetical protein
LAVTESTEIGIKLVLTVVAVGVLLWRARSSDRAAPAGMMLALVAVAAGLGYPNFLTFHAGRFTHFGENFHYQLGSKYFPELGYDGLYDASIAAQAESDPELPLPAVVRDLRSNAIVPVASLAVHRAEVRARFSPARWRAFVRDHRYFLELSTLRKLNEIRLDHGYNPTPTWTFVGRLFNRWLPLNATTVPLLALLDWGLLAAMVIVVRRTYGGRTAAVLVILFGLGYPWRYTWVGGAFLRYDWLAAVVVGVCMLARRRFATSGALFAYATAVRIFPALLLAGVAVVALRDLVRRADLTRVWRFLGGFAATLVVCVVAGALTGRGSVAWPEFVHDIEKHHGTWSTNTAGLELLFITSSRTMTSRLPANWPLADRWALWQAEMNRAHSQRRPFSLAAAALLLAALAAATWRESPDQAASLGGVAVFALLVLSCYYWVLLILVAMRRTMVAAGALLALNAVTLAIALLTPDTQIIYTVFSWGLVVLFAAVLAFAVRASVRAGAAYVAAH